MPPPLRTEDSRRERGNRDRIITTSDTRARTTATMGREFYLNRFSDSRATASTCRATGVLHLLKDVALALAESHLSHSFSKIREVSPDTANRAGSAAASRAIDGPLGTPHKVERLRGLHETTNRHVSSN